MGWRPMGRGSRETRRPVGPVVPLAGTAAQCGEVSPSPWDSGPDETSSREARRILRCPKVTASHSDGVVSPSTYLGGGIVPRRWPANWPPLGRPAHPRDGGPGSSPCRSSLVLYFLASARMQTIHRVQVVQRGSAHVFRSVRCLERRCHLCGWQSQQTFSSAPSDQGDHGYHLQNGILAWPSRRREGNKPGATLGMNSFSQSALVRLDRA